MCPKAVRAQIPPKPVNFKRRLIEVAVESPAPASPVSEANVLVVNSSQDMAKEITMQLTLSMPGCSITYAPTIELAKWILSRRRINLVVSSPVLPDGGIGRLRDTLNRLPSPPDVVVVGDMALKSAEFFGSAGYEFAAVRRLGDGKAAAPAKPPVTRKIKELGADLRNDLNNPLQEIVAMVFVAQASGALSEPTGQALEAIDRAAKNMAQVVSRLEDKILGVVK